jgi:hypothetical protein
VIGAVEIVLARFWSIHNRQWVEAISVAILFSSEAISGKGNNCPENPQTTEQIEGGSNCNSSSVRLVNDGLGRI